MPALRSRKKSRLKIPKLDYFWVAAGAILGVLLLEALYLGYNYYQSTKEYRSFSEKNNQKKLLSLSPAPLPAKLQQQLQQTKENKITEYRVPILMFHYVENVADKGDKTRISLNVNPYTFEQEIKTLVAAGYTFLTNSQLTDSMDGKMPLPEKPILLTFDDGYQDFYTDVFPILKKYKVKATAYVISGFLNFNNEMTTSELKEVAASGLVEIGAHTVHHVWLKKISLTKASFEIFQSRVTLQQITGQPVVSFAYPYGAFDDQAIQVVKDAGFSSAVSTMPGDDQSAINRYFLFRLRPGGRTGQVLLNWLNQTKF